MYESRTVAQLPDTDKSCHVFVEYLESTAVFFWLAGLAETTGAVEDLQEGIEVNCDHQLGVELEGITKWLVDHVQSLPTDFSRSLISARVGF